MKKILPSYSGQILILILLIIVVGFTILLSIISRSLVDVRIASNTEATNRAYFAAEAGVEEALKKIAGGVTTGGTIDFAAINKSSADYTISSDVSADFNYPVNVSRDDSVQINLLTDYALPSSGSNTGNIKICWGNSASDKPAIETTLIYENPVGSGTFLARKDAFDTDAASHGNNFAPPDIGTCTIGSVNYQFQKTLNYSTNPGTHYLLRVRFLYNTAAQPLGLTTTGVVGASGPLPAQGYEVISTGKTDLGTERKLKVFKQYPALPAIFDYVLFNGSTVPLTK